MLRSFNVLSAVDKVSLFLYLIMIAFGVMNIYGASVTDAQTSIFDISYRSGMQFLWITVSFTAALVILFLNSNIFNVIPYLLYALIIFVLIVTVFVAPDIKGSRSWLPLGPFSIQPAEFSKFVTALALAKVMSQPQFRLNTKWNYAMVMTLILLPMVIIVGQKETGSALVYVSFLFMLYRQGMPGTIPMIGLMAVILFIVVIRMSPLPLFGMEGVPLGLFIALIIVYAIFLVLLKLNQKEKLMFPFFSLIPIALYLISVPIHYFLMPINYLYLTMMIFTLAFLALLVMWVLKWRRIYLLLALFLLISGGYCYSSNYIFDEVLQPHQQMRIKVVLGMADDPTGVSYNTNQARIAIGSGGFLGKGYLEGTQTKLKYVPEQDTDFIFCTIGEEWGFIGSVTLLLLYLLFLMRLIYLAERQDYVFNRVYGYCVVGIFAFHLIINVGMVLGLAPVIGIPLPFFSYGGSSLLSFTILLFIFLKLDTTRLERVRR